MRPSMDAHSSTRRAVTPPWSCCRNSRRRSRARRPPRWHRRRRLFARVQQQLPYERRPLPRAPCRTASPAELVGEPVHHRLECDGGAVPEAQRPKTPRRRPKAPRSTRVSPLGGAEAKRRLAQLEAIVGEEGNEGSCRTANTKSSGGRSFTRSGRSAGTSTCLCFSRKSTRTRAGSWQ